MDDLAATVGFTPAVTIAVAYEGGTLWVPSRVQADHPLVSLIGLRAFRALVEAYAGDRLRIPQWSAIDAMRRDWRIATRLADREPLADVAASEGLTVRRVEQIRAELVLRGWLQYVGRGKGVEILGTGEVFDGPPGS